MEHYFDKIQKAHRSVHLSDAEKDTLDDAVLSFVDAHPLPASQPVQTTGVAPPRASVWSLFAPKFAYAMAAFVLLLGSGVGTVLASEKSLPGEALYTVKVNVAEEIRSVLTFTPEDKAAWETTRVERRLSEIKTLLEDGEAIEKTVIENVESHIESHSNKVAKAALSLQMQGDTDGLIAIVDQLQLSLETYGDVLAQIVQDDKGNVDPKVVALFESVEQTQQVAKAAQLDLLLDAEHIGNGGEDVTDAKEAEVHITYPQQGDILIMGTSYDIAWKADVPQGSYVDVSLLDEQGNHMGYIGAEPYPSARMEWNPKYILDISVNHQSVEVAPGFYRLSLTVRDESGKAYQTESGLFEIIKPSISTGKLYVDVLDGVGNPIQNAYVEVNRTNQKRLEVEYTDEDGRVDFSLLPGTYTIVVSSMRSDNIEERTVHIAEVGKKYLSISMVPSRTHTDIQESGIVDLTITDVSISPTNPEPEEWFTVTYVVENIGNPGIAGKRSHGMQILPSLATYQFEVHPDVNDSCAYKAYLTNEDRCVVKRTMKVNTPGQYSIMPKIDDGEFITELSESNNTLSYTVHIGEMAEESNQDIEITSPNGLQEFAAEKVNHNVITWVVHNDKALTIPATISLVDKNNTFVDEVIALPSLYKGSAVYNIPSWVDAGEYFIYIKAGEYTGTSERFSIIK